MMNDISAEMLRRILAGETVDGMSLGRGNATWDPSLSADQQPNTYEQVIYGNQSKPGWTTNNWDTWNTDGTYRGSGSGDSDALSTLKFLAASAGGYYGGQALSGLGGAGTGGAAAGADAAGGLTGWDAAMADLASSGGLTAGDFAATGGLTGLDAAAADMGAGATNVGSAPVTPTGPGWKIDPSTGKMIGGLLGAAAGAADSKDKQATTSKDPWAPSQPFLQNLLSSGQGLLDKFSANPLSADQLKYSQRINGLLDTQNSMMPGLLEQAKALGTFRKGR